MDTAQLKSDASAALAAGDFARAGTLFASYCAAAPADIQSLLRMGDAWARAGERARAVDAYLAAAQGFAADGFLARAIAASKLVLELEPGHQRMQRILADLYARRGVGPGVGRRPREVAPPPSPAPAAAPAEPLKHAPTDEDSPELVVTEFLLDTPSPERTLEDVLTAAVGPHGESVVEAPAPPPPLAPVAAPAEEAAPPPIEQAEPKVAVAGARFLELSLDETELPLAPAAAAKPPPTIFSLAEPGRAPVLAPLPVVPETHARVSEAQAASAVAVASEPEDGGYIDLFFDEDETLDASAPSEHPEVSAELVDEPLAEGTVAESRGVAEALASAVPKAPLFSDLSSEAFVELVERCPLRHFAAGERILQQDAPGEAFYIICEGQVVVRREEGVEIFQLARLSEGDFFGEMALMCGAPRVASVDALVDGTLVLEIST